MTAPLRSAGHGPLSGLGEQINSILFNAHHQLSDYMLLDLLHYGLHLLARLKSVRIQPNGLQ